MAIILFTVLDNNPYKLLAQQFTDGLMSIESTLTAGLTMDDLIVKIGDYVNPLYFPDSNTYDEVQFSPVIYNAVDSFMESNFATYSADQLYYIDILRSGIFQVPQNQIDSFFIDFQGNILKSSLSKIDQIPILIAIALGSASNNYWQSQVDTPSSPWYSENYFDASDYKNYLDLPYWVDACIAGVLSSANMAKTYGQFDPPRVIGIDMVSSLIAGLGLSAGIVMYKWMPKINTSMPIPALRSVVADVMEGNRGGGFTKSLLWWRCKKGTFMEYTCFSCVTTVPQATRCSALTCNEPNCQNQ